MQNNTNPENTQPKTKIYLRNHLKIAKILHLSKHINSQALYQYASENYDLSVENIHLYYAGEKVDENQEVIF